MIQAAKGDIGGYGHARADHHPTWHRSPAVLNGDAVPLRFLTDEHGE
jgi:hypothetical protein